MGPGPASCEASQGSKKRSSSTRELAKTCTVLHSLAAAKFLTSYAIGGGGGASSLSSMEETSAMLSLVTKDRERLSQKLGVLLGLDPRASGSSPPQALPWSRLVLTRRCANRDP